MGPELDEQPLCVKRAKLDKEMSEPEIAPKDVDKPYFSAYAELDIHREMINDTSRTNSYRWSILKNYELFYKKVVLDVGCGTGILSIFCAQAGAKKVYAVDASNIADQARKIVEVNHLSDKITVIEGKIEDIELPEKVDIIVSEFMGYMLLYESMLPSVLLARDRWLKEDGLIFPARTKLHVALASVPEFWEERVEFWSEVKSRYSVDMDVLKDVAKNRMLVTPQVISLTPEHISSLSACVADLDHKHVNTTELQCTESEFSLTCFGEVTIHCIAVWFTAEFPGEGLLSTSPYFDETHWQQTVLLIDPITAHQDTRVSGSICIKPNTSNHRFLDITLHYSIDDGPKISRHYEFQDCI